MGGASGGTGGGAGGGAIMPLGPPNQNAMAALGAPRPDFASRIENVTVNVGREAVLECRVNHLGRYKVGWLKAKDQTILALHKRVITHNPRIVVDHEENRYVPDQQRTTLNKLPTEVRRRNFVNEHRLSIHVGAKRARTGMQYVHLPAEFSILHTTVGGWVRGTLVPANKQGFMYSLFFFLISRVWKLKIRPVKEEDRGCYMCQINTEEMKKQIGCIDVLSEFPTNIGGTTRAKHDGYATSGN